MNTYAIGDIQGCMEPLQCLLKKIGFDPSKDHLWLAGDLINRGPDSLAVMRFLYSIRTSLTVVLGNHDLHFLAVALGHRKPGKHDTLDNLLNAQDLQQLISWLRSCKLFHHDALSGFSMVHAGIAPQWDIAQTQGYAREVEAVLQSDEIDNFLINMYGNEPAVWNEGLRGQDRLRVITNYLTRMRFCSAEGELNLEDKTGIDDTPAGFMPWFQHPARKTQNNKIIFGHWAALEGKTNTPNVFALDTGCVWGGTLTALRLEDEKLFSCECPTRN